MGNRRTYYAEDDSTFSAEFDEMPPPLIHVAGTAYKAGQRWPLSPVNVMPRVREIREALDDHDREKADALKFDLLDQAVAAFVGISPAASASEIEDLQDIAQKALDAARMHEQWEEKSDASLDASD